MTILIILYSVSFAIASTFGLVSEPKLTSDFISLNFFDFCYKIKMITESVVLNTVKFLLQLKKIKRLIWCRQNIS